MPYAKSWSFSSLTSYEQCPFRIKLKADGAPKPEDEGPNRGQIIHDAAQDYVEGTRPDLIRELNKFKEKFEEEREMHARGELVCERDWGFDAQWQEAPWETAWLRMKLDQFHYIPGNEIAAIIDHKSGKRWGNEVKHTSQGQLYAVGAFMKYPEIQSIDVRFRYTDEGKETSKVYFRDEKFDRYFEKWNQRANKMLTDDNPRPKPSKHNCRFCEYSPNPGKGSGACPYGVPYED